MALFRSRRAAPGCRWLVEAPGCTAGIAGLAPCDRRSPCPLSRPDHITTKRGRQRATEEYRSIRQVWPIAAAGRYNREPITFSSSMMAGPGSGAREWRRRAGISHASPHS
jgi:hypothetical protein